MRSVQFIEYTVVPGNEQEEETVQFLTSEHETVIFPLRNNNRQQLMSYIRDMLHKRTSTIEE